MKKVYFTSTLKKITKFTLLLLVSVSFITISSCKKDCEEAPPVADPLDEMIAMLDLQAVQEVQHPADNPTSVEKVELGRLLFWDPIVGGEKDMACATCHHPGLGYGDGIDLAIGVNGSGLGPDRTENTGGLTLDNGPIGRVPRNAPTVINAAYNGLTSSNGYSAEESPMFWDSRMSSFEEQCQGPPGSRSEMRGDAYEADDAMDSIALRLAANPEYVQLFNDAFGGEGVSVENYTKAMSAFERNIVAVNSPYDKYVAGDLNALNDDQKNGLILFHGKARCANCHFGPMFSDFDLHALGIPENPNSPHFPADSGAFNEFKFKTPTLRNITLTGPYMHNGMFTTLKDIVEYMNEGVSGNDNVTPDMLAADMAPLGLTEKEIDQIVAFLESLTDENFDTVVPTSVPSGLEVGGNID